MSAANVPNNYILQYTCDIFHHARAFFSLPINKRTMQTAIGSLQVNNVTMEAGNATMEA